MPNSNRQTLEKIGKQTNTLLSISELIAMCGDVSGGTLAGDDTNGRFDSDESN